MWGADTGGGGFMAGGTDSPAGGDKKPGRRSNNIMPVTVKQLLECTEDAFKLEGTDAHLLTLVGLITNLNATPAKLSLQMDDQTGTIECIHYAGSDGEDNVDATLLCEGIYGRVVGSLRSMKGQRYLIMFRATAVTDLNELTCHLLEVLKSGQKLRKLRLNEDQKPMNKPGNTFNNSLIGMGGSTGGISAGGGTGFNAKQSIVHGIISSVKTEGGIHKDDILARVKGRMSLKEAMEALDFLSNEGHIFSTIDDDHYASTEA